MATENLQRCRIVLVQPHIAGNLGATARVMRNMGLADLVLVAPQADPADRQARRLSTHGEDILDRGRIVDHLSAAIGECALVVGTSARTGGLMRRQSVGTPDQIMPRIVETLHAGSSAALVFGPEDRGLTNEEVARCHYLVHIPTDPAYPALNLAQAVGICLYELRRACLMMEPARTETVEPPAAFAAQELMFTRLRDASKVALVALVARLNERGFELFDIQMVTEHTVRMGAVEIARAEYLARLKRSLACQATFADQHG